MTFLPAASPRFGARGEETRRSDRDVEGVDWVRIIGKMLPPRPTRSQG